MIKPFVGGPLILLVDENPGRTEYLEAFFFQNGYLIVTATVNEVEEKGALDKAKLVLSYLPFQPEKTIEQSIPVIFAISDDSSENEQPYSDNSLVEYVSESVNTETLLEKIAALVDA